MLRSWLFDDLLELARVNFWPTAPRISLAGAMLAKGFQDTLCQKVSFPSFGLILQSLFYVETEDRFRMPSVADRGIGSS